jgi:hypothetical protein
MAGVSMILRVLLVALLLLLTSTALRSQPGSIFRLVSGTVVTGGNDHEVVPDVTVTAEYPSGKSAATTDAKGSFRLRVPQETVKLKVTGKYVAWQETIVTASGSSENLQIQVSYAIPPVHEHVLTKSKQ